MKKNIILLIAAFIIALTACNTNENVGFKNLEENKHNEYEGFEIMKWEVDWRNIHYDIENLVKNAELVVIGEFTNESKPTVEYKYDSYFKKDVITNFWSTNTIIVSEILKGEIDTNIISISQYYAIVEQEPGKFDLLTYSNLIPMNKGDQWIFFLSRDTKGNGYWLTGDYTARYPVPSDKMLEIGRKILTINRELYEWLSINSKLITTEEELEGLIEKDEYIYYGSDYKSSYHVPSKEQWNELSNIISEVEKYKNKISPHDFGVFDNSSINLWLYSDVLKYFNFI